MNRYLLLRVLFVILFASVSFAQENAERPSGKKFAFLVGITKYKHSKFFPTLDYTVKDVKAWKQRLEGIGFEPGNIVVLTSDEALFPPTKEEILDSLKKLLARAGKDDIVICMFSGHGTQIGEKPYFCPQDAAAETDEITGRPIVKTETCVSLNTVLDDMKNSRAKFKWLIVDACRNDPSAKSTADGVKSLGKVESVPKGVTAIFSCAETEQSFERQELGHGVFTHFLIQGLDGEAADEKGDVTILGLYGYVKKQTSGYVEKKYPARSQVPYWNGEFTDFVIRENVNQKKAMEAYQLAMTYRGQKDYEKAAAEINKALVFLPEERKFLDERELIEHRRAEVKRVAAEAERKAAEEKRAQAVGHAAKAGEFLSKKNYTEALKSIKEAIKLDGGNEAYASLQNAIIEQQKHAAAEAAKPKPKPTTTTKPPASTVSGSSGTNAGDRKVITVKGVSYAFRWCPAGTFKMGSPEGELGGYSSLEKQHQVTLTKGFWMLETEVTQEMWESVTGENPSRFKDSKKLPVEMVSWEDCQDYIRKLNALGVAPAGYKFSLPTEAQWEYACRAGTTTALNNGKNLTDEKYNCPNLYEVGWYDWKNDESKTHEVGKKKANAWGLFDMHGNVYEWCLDWYGDYPGGSVTDPTGPTTGSSRVLRGGGWSGYAGFCRSAYRSFSDPTYRNSRYGVRPALVRE